MDDPKEMKNARKLEKNVGQLTKLKGRRPRRTGDDACDGVTSPRKTRPFDDDRGPYVFVEPDPRVDSKATIFIANFHAARVSESERQIYQQAAGKSA
ncbi:hypothetical protein SADUNF_Sadunf13G0001900 [Salix dunnii]|uniref:Uncharacterized protein n=1 Tax=Salix dunnii TaxID=1413687 RepID=A0A835JJK1_9ROSI|nr:hypothetical protein SADUNF_Sadunf13G0001900 [Salix dunnii]